MDRLGVQRDGDEEGVGWARAMATVGISLSCRRSLVRISVVSSHQFSRTFR